MKKLTLALIILYTVLTIKVSIASASNSSTLLNKSEDQHTKEAKLDILCMLLAYPEHISNVSCEKSGEIFLIFKNGDKLLYNDNYNKSHEQKLNNPDVQDMLEQYYPLKNTKIAQEKNYDPGRARIYSLLKYVYGNNKLQIEKKLVKVGVGGRFFQFNSSNGAAEALTTSINSIKALAAQKPSINNFIYPCSGTYNYRVIAGTNRLSAHSFGIAIDLASNRNDYWKWATREKGEERIKSYPDEIVTTFENNGFVWGGKWGHFDILHFEYRPEIILKAKLMNCSNNQMKYWYFGADTSDEKVADAIEKVNNAFE